MHKHPGSNTVFEADVTSRFGILPNFFRSAHAAPELMSSLGFAKAGYLDNPMPSVFKSGCLFAVSILSDALLHRAARRISIGRSTWAAAGDANA